MNNYKTNSIPSFSGGDLPPTRNSRQTNPMEHKESWEEEFREYFDRTLKPKKQTIVNLDREIIIDFIRSLLSSERKAVEKEMAEKIKNLKKEIRSKEGTKNPSDWSDTGKVVYYYLSKLEE